MAFDFKKLGSLKSADTVNHPREIFTVLPNKQARYQYPRDVQTQVWNQWFNRRSERDIVIRMNTGSGKTVVGLLLLKSCLNEQKGPAVYLTPDQYLTRQVIQEAAQLDLEVTSDPHSIRFQRGKAILVTTIRTLVNGQSAFGVSEQGIKIPIGSVLVDDAHACLESVEAQFTLSVDGAAFSTLHQLFRDDLRQQSESTALEVESSQPGRFMPVPFWSFIDKITNVAALFHEIEKDNAKKLETRFTEATREAVRFNYPLIKDALKLCQCVLGEGRAELSPKTIPISSIPSFASAERRIVMSATLSNDSVLVSHFDVQAQAILSAITPETANDIGDRMILVPQEINADSTDEELKAMFVRLSSSHNVIVIVPSNYRAKHWEDVAKLTLRANNLDEGITRLEAGHVGLVVLVNKYDGIDLPKHACEVLVIDGLPDVRRGIDKVEEGILYGTEEILSQRIQRIEQGMGRGVRANDDWCLVFLTGKTLTSFLYKADAKSKFSAATRAQLALSERVADELHGKGIQALEELSQSFLERNKEWVAVSKGALVDLKYEKTVAVSPLCLKQRSAFDAALRNDFRSAARKMNEAGNECKDVKLRGWVKQQLASFTHAFNPPEAQLILRTAVSDNPRITRPIGGIDYQRLSAATSAQSSACAEWLKNSFENGNELIVEVNSICAKLDFQPHTAEIFERTVKDLGFLLGFLAHRPEDEFGRGPDVLWAVGDLTYFVIECKNGVTSENPINKHDCNQLNGSALWFAEKYDSSCSCVPILIHPKTEHEYAATLNPECGIVDESGLSSLRDALRGFSKTVASNNWGDVNAIASALKHYELTREGFKTFTKKATRRGE